MSAESIAAPSRVGVDWRRAEFVLTLLAFLCFLALPIRITTIYGGMPAHPLFVHAPVVLIPTTIVAALVFMFKREWFERYGIAPAVVSIVAMGSIFLAMQAGAALRGELKLQGESAKLILWVWHRQAVAKERSVSDRRRYSQHGRQCPASGAWETRL